MKRYDVKGEVMVKISPTMPAPQRLRMFSTNKCVQQTAIYSHSENAPRKTEQVKKDLDDRLTNQLKYLKSQKKAQYRRQN